MVAAPTRFVFCAALALAGGCRPEATDLGVGDAGADAAGDADAAPPCRLGGSSTTSPATVACGQNITGRLVLADDNVYWTIQGPGDVVMKAPLRGGAPVSLARATLGAAGLVIVGGYAYYTLPAAGRVMRVPTDGGGAELVAKGLTFPIFLASDGAALFLTNGQNFSASVVRLSLDPRAPDARPPVTLMDGLSAPRGIAVADGFVYWTDVLDGTLVRTAIRLDDAAADGGTRSAVRLAAGIKGPSDLVLRDGWAYLADQGGTVVRVPLAGGSPDKLVPDAHGRPYGVATDGVSIFWTTIGVGGVFRAPLTGGAVEALVEGESEAHFIAAGADAVYWGAWGNGGTIKRVAKQK